MSNITHKTIARVAFLARLHSSSEDVSESFVIDVVDILVYAKQLATQASSDVIRPTLPLSNLRNDIEQTSPEYQQVRENILKLFPNRQGDLLILPGIFDDY